MTTPSESLRALMSGLVDYAGLFPPASLPMSEAVAAYARYRAGREGWALGRFVVPMARLDEFADAASAHWIADDPWRVAVLGGADDAPRIEGFNSAHAGRALIDTVEAKAATVEEVTRLAPLVAAGRAVYVELPLGDSVPALVAALATHGLRAKIRTGGVTAEAFPSAAAVADFLGACAAAGVPCKATAGLHHPVRGEYRLTYAPDSPSGTMFGFLNVICASMLIGHGIPVADAVALLEERDPAAFHFEGNGIRWRDWLVPVGDIANARAAGANSFGSCSFEEPIHDLQRLALL